MAIRKEFWRLAWPAAAEGLLLMLLTAADLLELEMPLSSYTSRHTWATTARNHNVPLSVISAGMGHASEKTTQIYLASLESSVIDQANRSIIASLYV